MFNDLLLFNITKGIYKIHNKYYNLEIPLIKDLISHKIKKIKNQINFVNLNKQFQIYPNILFINEKIDAIIKDEIMLYLLSKFINILSVLIKDKDNKRNNIKNFNYLLEQLGYKEIPLGEKKVMGETQYFITKDVFYKKIVGFYIFNDEKIKNIKIFFEPKLGKDIRQIKIKDKIYIPFIDCYITFKKINEFKKSDKVINFIMYYLLLDILESNTNNNKLNKELIFFIKFFLGYEIMPRDIQLYFFDKEDNLNKKNLKEILKNYYTLILQNL